MPPRSRCSPPPGLRERLDGHDLVVIDIDDPGIHTQPATALPCPAPDDIAYLIYTSGTTGVSKGVAITHDNVTQLIGSLDRRLAGPGQVRSQWHSYSFDISGWEIFGALLHGGRLVVVPESVAGSPEDLHAVLVAEQVSVLSQTLMAVGALSPQGLESVVLLVGGEACPGAVVDRMGARAGGDQRIRPDRDHDVGGDECAADAGVGDTVDWCPGVRGGVVCARWVVACGAGRGGRGVVCGRPGGRCWVYGPGAC